MQSINVTCVRRLSLSLSHNVVFDVVVNMLSYTFQACSSLLLNPGRKYVNKKFLEILGENM